jgi:hypothetical protein
MVKGYIMNLYTECGSLLFAEAMIKDPNQNPEDVFMYIREQVSSYTFDELKNKVIQDKLLTEADLINLPLTDKFTVQQ